MYVDHILKSLQLTVIMIIIINQTFAQTFIL